jgi:Na+(H+)/acetate symporter ActP
VQAFQYWLKLTAVAVPALALLAHFGHEHPDLGGPLPPTVDRQTVVTVDTDVVVTVADPAGVTVSGPGYHGTLPGPGQYRLPTGTTLTLAAGAQTPVVAGAPASGATWITNGGGLGGKHPLYQVFSIMVATFLGAMGLPHVLVRFYTNPDARAARRTALAVIGLLSLFYLFPVLLGVFARLYVPQLLITGKADAAVLLLPSAAVAGLPGELLGALVAAGAIAAFLATSSGLLVSIAGALSTDVLRGRVRDFRMAALIAGLIPIPLSVVAPVLDLSRGVGLAFAVAASTLCPLLVLGIWWRGLTSAGAIAGLTVGALASGLAIVVAVTGWVDDDVLGGWLTTLIGYPAAVTVPLAFATMVLVSRLTRADIPPDVARVFARMHVPERLGMGVERVPGGDQPDRSAPPGNRSPHASR